MNMRKLLCLLASVGLLLSLTFVVDNRGFKVNAAGVDDFVTTWKTDNAGVSADNQITIPTNGIGYNYNVDWGDGNTDALVTGDITHTYAVPGTYTVRISGTFPRIYFNNGGDKDKILTVDQWGTGQWNTMINAFYGCSNLNVVASDTPDLSTANILSGMFRSATSMDGDIDAWDVSNISDMSSMFFGATSFNQDLNNWNTIGVSNMSSMFRGATSFDGNISDWDTDNVTNMFRMFYQASDFNQNIGGWNTAKVTNTREMFLQAYEFDQDIDGWIMTKVKDTRGMFLDAIKFNQDLNSWDTSSVLRMGDMFRGATAFDGNIADWETGLVIDMNQMFEDAVNFNQNLNGWDLTSNPDVNSMFRGATAFDGNIADWDVSGIDDMTFMFLDAINFNQPIDNWVTSSVVTMSDTFRGATAFDADISGWDVSSVEDMNQMFDGASSFNQDLGDWDVSSVTRMDKMFNNATLFDADISEWDVSSVTDMSDFLTGTAFSTQNYDVLLLEWSELTLQPGVTFSATGANYCHGEAGRDLLEAEPNNWLVGDAGLDCTDANKFATAVLVDGENQGSVPENSVAVVDLGLLTATDPDVGDTHTFSKTCAVAGPDDDLFTLDVDDRLWTDAVFDFESPSDANGDGVYEVCLVVTDDGKPNISAELNAQVVVSNVNEAPIGVSIDGLVLVEFDERQRPGAAVGVFETDDNGETSVGGYDYAFSCKNPGADEEFFSISSDILTSTEELFFSSPRDADEDGVYEICIVTTDDGGFTYEGDIDIVVVSVPTRSGSASTNDVENPFESKELEEEEVESEEEKDKIVEEYSLDEEVESENEETTEAENETDLESESESEHVDVDKKPTGGGGGGSSQGDMVFNSLTRGEFLSLILKDEFKDDFNVKGIDNQFVDLDPSMELFSLAMYASELDILRGYEDNEARLGDYINRAEALAMVVRFLETKRNVLESENSPYRDVPEGAWYGEYVLKGINEGLVDGEGEQFEPSKNLSKEYSEFLLDEVVN
jgi:surface protein